MTEINKGPKHATVIGMESISSNIRRISLQSEEFKTFSKSQLGDYVKLLFTPEGDINIHELNDPKDLVKRTFSIMTLDPTLGIIGIDFAKHEVNKPCLEKGGYAMYWAANAQIGDVIYIAGSGVSQVVDFNAEQVLLMADMTALPALTHVLSTLPENAKGDVFVQVAASDDAPNWTLPIQITLHKVVSRDPLDLSSAVEKEAQFENTNDVAIWCACEFTAMKGLRNFCRNKNIIQREKSYFSSYWKQGVTEDGHKVIKRADAAEYQ